MKFNVTIAVVSAFVLASSADCQTTTEKHVTFWATGDSLMPAWGFYPNSAAYGGTKPLGERAAWCAAGNEGQLTWVADFPRDGDYQVWIRKYGGYGKVKVLVDEQPVSGGKGGPGGGRYVWHHIGQLTVKKGQHHVDLMVSLGMYDAILLTTDAELKPAEATLPKPVDKPTLQALRTYRDDRGLADAERNSGFVVGHASLYSGALYDEVFDKPLDRLRIWGAPDQYINGTFAIRAIAQQSKLTVSLEKLASPDGSTIGSEEIDVRVVHVRERKTTLFRPSQSRMLVAELLLRDDRTTLPPKGKQGGYGGGQCVTRIPAHQSRQIGLTIHVPKGQASGIYRGEISIANENNSSRKLPIELEVLPIPLQPAEGYYAIYHRSQSTDPKRPHYVSPERYLAELKDHVRHSLNAATLYGGFSTLDLARRAGMTKAPCLMHWPGSDASEQVAAAKKMGFDDLYYYGVDEPNKPDQIERCRKEAERRQQAGLHMFTAINGKTAQAATRDFIDRPVYNIYVFGGRNNAETMYVRKKGFRPISYWVSATTYPLAYRALTGLYNKACGYQGSSPWAYQDYPDNRLYDPDNPAHKVAYPDQFGQPIPTLAWEAHRAGIDDVRYLEALDRTIATARKRLKQPGAPPAISSALEEAARVRKAHYESITGRWFEYLCRIRPDDLEQARRSLADATVRLCRVLKSSPSEISRD